jgi:ParB family chromosome partitioning protein
MRLLRLPDRVLLYLRNGELGFSEARVLLRLEGEQMLMEVAHDAVRKHWSVEQLESVIVNLIARVPKQPKNGRARWVDPNVRAVQQDLERTLGVRVRIRDRRGKGSIVIEYGSLEDFDRVAGMLKGH